MCDQLFFFISSIFFLNVALRRVWLHRHFCTLADNLNFARKATKDRVYLAKRAKEYSGMWRGCKGWESYREWRTLAQKTLSARAARYFSLLMNPARGTPLEEHFYFCHSVCRQTDSSQWLPGGMSPSHTDSQPFLSSTARIFFFSWTCRTRECNEAKFRLFPLEGCSYQSHVKKTPLWTVATHKRQMDYFKFIQSRRKLRLRERMARLQYYCTLFTTGRN